VTTLEAVLRKHPDHPGANHYYIHAVEASPDPARALPSADRLGTLAPRSGHLVHMPSHIYLRTGRYHDAVVVNERAVKVDTDFLRETGEAGFYPLSYYTHNYHFLCYAETMEGRGNAALKTARELERHLPLDKVRAMPMAEYLVPIPYFVEVRFAMWNEVLHEPEPPKDLLYTTGIWHYARGMALAANGKLEQALEEQRALDQSTTQTPADYPLGTSNHAKDVLTLASTLLTGEIAASKGDHDNAVAKLAQTVKLQDALVYDEPPDWYYPVRESLGAELLAAGEPAKAEQVYHEDLKLNPGNPRSLYGLAQVLKKEGKLEEAIATAKLFRVSWQYADGGESVLSVDGTPVRAGRP
jgi:tetratricopeptide (TPR) repeat protein